MSLDSQGPPPIAIDSTGYLIWRRQCDSNRALFRSYGNPHPHVGNSHPAVREPYVPWNVEQLYFKNAEESARR